MALVLDGTTGVPVTTVTGTLPVANGGSGGSTSTGTGAVVLASSPSLTTPALGTPASGVLTNCTGTITLGTAVASTSGTSIDFTGIPTGTKRITIMLVGVSTNGTSNYLVQIGDSGGVEATSYFSSCSRSNAPVESTAGFIITSGIAAVSLHTGKIVLDSEHTANFTWVSSSHCAADGSSIIALGVGSKSTSAELDRVRITTVNGTDTFDAGAINISYER